MRRLIAENSKDMPENRLHFSVGSKLLAATVILLLAVIGFLSSSAILLLREDKQAYIYQSQATQVAMSGASFVSSAHRALDTLRVTLAGVSPEHPLTAVQQTLIQTTLDNQLELTHVRIGWFDEKNASFSVLSQVQRKGVLGAPANLETQWLQTLVADLPQKGVGFLNLSSVGGAATLGVLLADRASTREGRTLVALGEVALADYASQVRGMKLTLATRAGWTLFDTDPSLMYSRRNIADDVLFEGARKSKLAAGAGEFHDESGRFLGSYSLPGLDLMALTRVPWQQAMRATYTLTEKFIFLGGMAIGLGIILSLFFAKSLTHPINQLYDATRQVAQGDFELRLAVESRDEIGALTGAFNDMSQQINGLIAEKMKNLKMQNEVAIASTVQQTLMPKAEFQSDWAEIHGLYRSASQCGGDWWGYFEAQGKLVFMIADATGMDSPAPSSRLRRGGAPASWSGSPTTIRNLVFRPRRFSPSQTASSLRRPSEKST